MADFKEKYVGIKFCFDLGKTVTETFEILKLTFREETMSRTQTYPLKTDASLSVS
jgi:hypothetical protein